MRWGIGFNVEPEYEYELSALPPPSSRRYLTRMNKTKSLQVLYHFEYAPQSWKEWQRTASIKIQMKEKAPHINFIEYDAEGEYERLYTVSDLGKHFPEFIKYQKPYYPDSKGEFMRKLTLYAQRLYYERQFHFEAVLAMALHFNTVCSLGYSFREINRKARAIFELNTDDWKAKLSVKERHRILSESAYKSAEAKKRKSQGKKADAVVLREKGMVLKKIAETLNISLSTVRRYLADAGCV